MEKNYFEFSDILAFMLWLAIILIYASNLKGKIKDDNLKGYFNQVVAFKIFMALLFSVFYIFYYGGGDTTAYWDGAVSLNKLLINNPINFIEHLISEPTEELRINHFNMETGFPPGWIYREKEAWFVCKITSFISLITFRSYIAGTIVFAFSIAIVSFKIFEIVSKTGSITGPKYFLITSLSTKPKVIKSHTPPI